MAETLLTFAHISDTHFVPNGKAEFRQHHYSPRLLAFFKEMTERGIDLAAAHSASVPADVANSVMVDEINNLPFNLDFVLHTGDVMTDPDSVEEYETAKAVMSNLRYPVYYLRGNHDHLDGIRSLMPQVTTRNGSLDYVIEQNGVRIVCVDSATYGEDHGGHMTDEQLTWLEEQLMAAPDKPLLAAVHHMPVSLGSEMMDFFGMSNSDAVHAVFKKAVPRLQAVFYGHIHQVVDIIQDGVYYCCVQSSMGQPDLWPSVVMNGSHAHIPNPGFSVVVVTTERTYIRRYNYALPQA
jgi:3',5'-cyclic-AMP phosphodiesterase